MSQMMTNPAREILLRANFPGPGLKRSADGEPAVMFGELAVFDEWTEIHSRIEGHFMERVARGAFTKTFREGEGRIKVLFNHGLDPSIGLKPIGSILELREDDAAARYEVEILDAPYAQELVPGLAKKLYGTSFRMRPTTLKVEVVRRPRASAYNPKGLPEHTIRETGIFEFGPVTFAAYTGASAGMRSLTDDFVRERLGEDDPEQRAWTPRSSILVPGDVDLRGGDGLAEDIRASVQDDRLYARSIDLVADEPWLIHPAAFATIKSLLRERAAGAKPTPEEVAARIDGLQRQAPDTPQGTVAVIPLYGPIVPKATLFTQVSGTASVEGFQKSLRAALESNDVSAIVIDIDSPGGMAAMIRELGDEVMAARDVKPIVGVANFKACSAAYWIMACCTEAVATPSAIVGSVGACADHTDLTAAMKNAGVKVTEFESKASPYKLELSPLRPLSDEARTEAQARIDRLGELFVSAVATARGVPEKKVLAEFGQGRVLSAEEALAAGMIDRIATLEETVARLGDNAEEIDPDEDEDAPLPADEEEPDGDGDEPAVAASAVDALHGADPGHSANGAETSHSEDRSRSSDPAAAATPDNTNLEGGTNMSATLAEKKGRQLEIGRRLKEINIEFPADRMPDDTRAEWDGLLAEDADLKADIADVESRLKQLTDLGIGDDGPRKPRTIAGTTREAGFSVGVPRVEDPFDFTTLRSNSLNPEQLGAELRDRARMAIEGARFRQPNVSQEDAQTSAERLLEEIDTKDGALARHMLVTGSEVYRRAFNKSLGGIGLSVAEQQAMDLCRAASLVDAQGGFAVPFTLDPTVVLTSDGVTNPIRAISRVAQTVTDNWHGVTSQGVVAAYRGGEFTEAIDGAPTLAQPEVIVEEADAFIPYSYAVGQDWVGIGSDLAFMIADAKDVLEADKFLFGAGHGSHEPEGVISGLDPSSWVETASAHTFAPADVYNTMHALPPRFRANGQWVANLAIYDKIRNFDTAGGAQLWMRIGEGMLTNAQGNTGAQLLGRAANEASEMDDTTADGALILLVGNFQKGFVVVDRVGMSVELIPNLFGPNGRPTGQRGLYAYWRNSSKVLVDNAFRLLRVSPS